MSLNLPVCECWDGPLQLRYFTIFSLNSHKQPFGVKGCQGLLYVYKHRSRQDADELFSHRINLCTLSCFKTAVRTTKISVPEQKAQAGGDGLSLSIVSRGKQIVDPLVADKILIHTSKLKRQIAVLWSHYHFLLAENCNFLTLIMSVIKQCSSIHCCESNNNNYNKFFIGFRSHVIPVVRFLIFIMGPFKIRNFCFLPHSQLGSCEWKALGHCFVKWSTPCGQSWRKLSYF